MKASVLKTDVSQRGGCTEGGLRSAYLKTSLAIRPLGLPSLSPGSWQKEKRRDQLESAAKTGSPRGRNTFALGQVCLHTKEKDEKVREAQRDTAEIHFDFESAVTPQNDEFKGSFGSSSSCLLYVKT